MRKKISLLVIISMLAIMLPIVNSSAGSIFAGGDGTEENPYLINTTTQLKIISDLPDMNYKLIGDLDLSNVSWVTIGSKGDNFSGTFDGNYHKIINAKSTIFDKNNGTIKNLVVEGTTSNLINSNYGTIYNCSILGNIESCYKSSKGLLVNNNYNNGIINSCFAEGNINADVYGETCMIGGIVGDNYGTVIDSYSKVSLNGTVSSSLTWSSSFKQYFTSDGCLYIGGLIGRNSGSVEKCYSVGEVSYKIGKHVSGGQEKGFCGGLVGYTGSDSVVTDSYYNKDNANYTGTNTGTPKTTLGMKLQAIYKDWDFDTVWAIDENINDGYPYLRWQYPETEQSKLTITGAVSAEHQLGFIAESHLTDEDTNVFGVEFVPESLYNTSANRVKATYDASRFELSDGATFGAVLTNIPDGWEDVRFAGRAFAEKLSGEYIWSEAKSASINDTELKSVE